MRHQAISRTLTAAVVIASFIIPAAAEAATFTLTPLVSKPVVAAPLFCGFTDAPARVVDPWPPVIPGIVVQRNFGEPYGSTQVSIDLDSRGALVGSRLFASSGTAALDREALVSARRSRYAAERSNCNLQRGTYLLTVDFDN